MQYQQYPFVEGGYAPYPIESPARTTGSPTRTRPSWRCDPRAPSSRRRTGSAAGTGRAGSRSAGCTSHAPGTREYTPLLAMADPGGPEQKGALLVAKLGKGRYVYTGLAFFRQLPAGVPGAYRLLANLLAWKS